MPLPTDAFRSNAGQLYLTWEEAAAHDCVPILMQLIPIEGEAERRVMALKIARTLFEDRDNPVFHALCQIGNLLDEQDRHKAEAIMKAEREAAKVVPLREVTTHPTRWPNILRGRK